MPFVPALSKLSDPDVRSDTRPVFGPITNSASALGVCVSVVDRV